jgi:hypothetical protein
MKLGLSTLWTEEPAHASAGDRTRLFAAHLSKAAERVVVSDRGPASSPPVARKRRTSKTPRAARPAPLI